MTSLELQTHLDVTLIKNLSNAGSTLFRHRWRRKVTPSGRPYLERQALALRTSDSVFTSWPTPTETDGKRGGEMTPNMSGVSLQQVARMAAWGTPKISTGAYQYSRGDKTKPALNLEGQAHLAAWATPTEHDHRTANLKPYSERGGGVKGEQLNNQARHLCPWPNPDPSMDSGGAPIGYLLGPQGWEIVPASGQLAPEHSRWLMGLPPEWDIAAIAASRLLKKPKRAYSGSEATAMRSMPKRPQRS